MTTPTTQSKPGLVWSLVLLLFIFHQDCWWWNDRTLIFGFLPIGLFYHALFSLAAGLIWALANKLAWPEDIEEWASGTTEDPIAEGGEA